MDLCLLGNTPKHGYVLGKLEYVHSIVSDKLNGVGLVYFINSFTLNCILIALVP